MSNLYCSTNNPDLKVSVTRDRNFNTPYYSNPYGYSKNVFQKEKPKMEFNTSTNSPVKAGCNRAFNPDTKTIISPLASDSPLRSKSLVKNIAPNENILNRSKTLRQKNMWVENGK